MSFIVENQTVVHSISETIFGLIILPNCIGTSGPTGPTGPIGNIVSPIINSIVPNTGYTRGPATNVATDGNYFPNPSSAKSGGLDLGSPNAPFANLWVGDINVSSETIYVGGVPISSDPVTKSIILPSGSTIGGGSDPGTLVLTSQTTGGGGSVKFYTDSMYIYDSVFPDNAVFSITNTGNMTIFTPYFNNEQGSLSIIGSPDGSFLPTSNNGTMFHVTGQPSLPSRIINDSSNSYAVFAGRRSDGTSVNPTPVQSGETIVRFSGNPYVASSSNGGFTQFGTARIDFVAIENQTTNTQGSRIDFYTTPVGTKTIAKNISIDYNGINFSSDGSTQNTAGIPLTQKGVANGVATLDSNGTVPLSQINAELRAQVVDLQTQVNTLKAQISQIFQVWNMDLFEPHIVNDMLS